MNKLIVVHNIFPSYIKGFWDKLIYAKNFDVEFYFSKKEFKGIKAVHLNSCYSKSEQKRFKTVKNITLLGYLIWQSSIIKTCLFKNYEAILFLGEMTIISTWIGAIFARLRGKKVIFRGHGMYGNEKGFKLFFRKLFYKIPSFHLVYSERSKNIMIKNGFLKDKINVIYNSLDFDSQKRIFNNLQIGAIQKNWFFFDNDKPIIFFLGRLTREKKIHLLIETISNLKEKGFIFNLLIIGGGEEIESLKKKSERLIDQKTCHFTGPVFNEIELANYIFYSDLCISPGNIGLSAIHSLTYGTPVVTHNNHFNQGPEYEVIEDYVNGFLFEEDDINSLEKNIKKWFKEYHNKVDKNHLRKIIDLKYNTNYQLSLIKKILHFN